MPIEAEQYEEKSDYTGMLFERLRLVKSLVAMANTAGGTFSIKKVSKGLRELDSASLDQMVNRWVDPPVHGIKSEQLLSGEVRITIARSSTPPHIFKKDGDYKEQDKQKFSFHKGQIWVRHSSGNATANADDLRSIVQRAAGTILEQLGTKIREPSYVLDLERLGTPVHFTDDENAVPVFADPNKTWPHTRQSLRKEFDKSENWIAAAIKKLGFEERKTHAHCDLNSKNKPARWRYSDLTREAIAKALEQDPEWDPIH